MQALSATSGLAWTAGPAAIVLVLCACRGSSARVPLPETASTVSAPRPAPGAEPGLGIPGSRERASHADPASIAIPRFHRGDAPVYPEMSRRLGEEGAVELWFELRSDGTVASMGLATSSGHARLDQAALAAARTWQFTPRTGPDEVEVIRHRLVFRLVEGP